MGLFSWFSKDASLQRRKEGAQKKLTNMYYQPMDRRAAASDMARLAAEGDDDAILILLRRFEHIAPNHFIDQEEKELVHDLLIELGPRAVASVRTYVRKTSQPVYWPLRVLAKLEGLETSRAFLAELLEQMDNGYWRDPQKKTNIVQTAAEHNDDAIAVALIPFVEDHHEDVRYAALDALLKYGRHEAQEALLARLAEGEESQRLIARLASGFAELDWSVAARSEQVGRRLPREFLLGPEGRVVRRTY
jgi:HEAT repeat protein